ncbi:MAG: hypothetical protein FJ294_08640 [Planctomycetes bacterium]|nr:hypothetical protein [Planctomycetota bacterium]
MSVPVIEPADASPLSEADEQHDAHELDWLEPVAQDERPVVRVEPERVRPAAVTGVLDARLALRGVLEGARGLGPVSLANAAVSLGPDIVPELLAGILGRGEWPEGETAATGDIRVAALRDAWVRYEPQLRAAALLACAAPHRDERRVLVELAGELGGEVALPTVLRIARGFEPLDLARDFVAEPVERALALALRSSKASERQLESSFDALSPELASALVRGWAHSGDLRGPALAARALGRVTALDLKILSALAQPACPARAALGERSLAGLRRSLASPDPEKRRCAAAALRNAGDTRSIDALALALDDVDALVRATARDALRAIAGRDLGGDSAAWKGWLLERSDWLEAARPLLLERAAAADCGAAMEALAELLARGDARDELVHGLAELHGASACDTVQARARSALEEIGSARSLALARQADG